MKKINICIAGSTGLVGRDILKFLNDENQVLKITTITRRKIESQLSKEINLNTTFDNLTDLNITADVFICALGTTIKIAKTKAAFRKVDFDYVVHFAKLAESVNAKKLIIVSALGANADSKVYYNKIKGEMEDCISNLKIPTIEFFQPSLLLGDRSESRPLEFFAKSISPLSNLILAGPLKKYRTISSCDVARAIAFQALKFEKSGVAKFESDQIQKIADQLK